MEATQNTSWAASAAARLGLPHGEWYLRGYAFLPGWVLLSVALVAAACFFWKLTGRRLGGFWSWGAGRLSTRADALAVALFCAGIAAAFDAPGFLHGFFREDDFSFLEVAQTPVGLGRQVLLYHNDHLYPLYRAEVWATLRMAGAGCDAHSLAGWFNAVNFVVCTGLLLSGCWLLHELGASRLAVFAMAFVTWVWPGWGEFTAGYYTLSAYIQVQALGFCAAAALVRGLNKQSTAWMALSLAAAVAATGMNISGVCVFGCLGLIAALWRRGEAVPARIPYLAALVLAFVGVYAFFLLVRHPYSARELVQNPAGTPAGVGMVANVIHNPLGAAMAAAASIGGLFLNLVTPTFLQFGAPRLATAPVLRTGIIVVELLVSVLVARFTAGRMSRMPAIDRWPVLALLGCACVCLAIVVVGRTPYVLTTPAVMWFAKYMIMPTSWLCAAIVLLMDRSHARSAAFPGKAPAWALATLLFGIWFTVSDRRLERTLFPGPLAYTPRGRWGNAANAVDRATSYDATVADLQAIARDEGTATVTLPPPARWGQDYFGQHPVLEWGQDYTPNGVGNLFWDFLAASPNLRLQGTWAPGSSFSPELRLKIEHVPWLRNAFMGTPSDTTKLSVLTNNR